VPEGFAGQAIRFLPASLRKAGVRQLRLRVGCHAVEIVLLAERDRPLEIYSRFLVLPDLAQRRAQVP